jgi:hypothetical protein
MEKGSAEPAVAGALVPQEDMVIASSKVLRSQDFVLATTNSYRLHTKPRKWLTLNQY